MSVFKVFLKDVVSRKRKSNYKKDGKIGMLTVWGKTVFHLKQYINNTIELSKNIESCQILWCPDNWNPAASGFDVVVYVVADINESVIQINGGNISQAVTDLTRLGTTEIKSDGSAISEVYWDRVFGNNVKVLAGAIFHEIAHNKSLTGREMHKSEFRFLNSSSTYHSEPNYADLEYLSKYLENMVLQKSNLKLK